MHNFKTIILKLKISVRNVNAYNFCTETQTHSNVKKFDDKYTKGNHTRTLNNYFKSKENLVKIKEFIPKKYLEKRRASAIENLYLVDSDVAKLVTKLMLPYLNNTLVCESNAGLGLITSELLENNINLVRIYESCPDFRIGLKDFNQTYPRRVELFVKDLFQINRMSYMDRLDRGNRVKQMLRGVSKRAWVDDPVMTVIGALPKIKFIYYIMRILALQKEIVTYGRTQLFCFLRPADYIKLTAGPHLNLHTYQLWSVLFNLFFEINMIEKFPRNSFLPWEQKHTMSACTRYYKKIDLDLLYFVRINFKKELPVEMHQMLPLYYFVKQFFARGTIKIIPSIEKLIPGLGSKIIASKIENCPHIGIYTRFGSLSPDHILALFKEMVNYEGYDSSSFAALVDAELLKSETVETDQDLMDFNSDIIYDLEEKM